MSDFTSDEIAQILQAAELLKEKGSSQKINVQRFCEEAGISRKNAYKHKNNRSPEAIKETIASLQKVKETLEEQLRLAMMQAEQADVYKRLFDLSVAIRVENKKNNDRVTERRRQLIDEFNNIAGSHGIKLLSY
jgi:hypothetical protein